MASVLMFASAREAAGERATSASGTTVQEVLEELTLRYGESFARLLPYCSFFMGEDKVPLDYRLGESDEIAILPPVSGG